MDYSTFRRRCFMRFHPFYYFFCGSSQELPIRYTLNNLTDTDIMFYVSDMCAISWKRNPPKNFKGMVLRIESDETPPGYVKLRICQKTQPCESMYFCRPKLLSSSKTYGPSIPDNFEIPIKKKFLFDRFNPSLEPMRLDIVFSVYCPYWPIEADEWRFRKRNNGWPNQKLIVRIARGGCHFVSKLRTWDTCDDTEWRFSFSKAELILIHSWTHVQKYVYHIVRVIKTNISRQCDANEKPALQTYFFKTLMFWACEKIPRENWILSNVEINVREILGRMVECLIELQCPSYFIPDCNIMAHLPKMELEKILSLLVSHRQDVSKYIRQVLSTIGPIVYFPKADISIKKSCIDYIQTVNNLLKDIYKCGIGRQLSDYEWLFLEVKYLYSAIEAHLRLMSFDNVSSRRESKDHILCLSNFDRACDESCTIKTVLYFKTDQSQLEMINEFMRMSARGRSFHDAPNLPPDWKEKKQFLETTILQYDPPPFYILTTVYKINFYCTALQTYDLALEECEQLQQKLMSALGQYQSNCGTLYRPVLISTSYSPIFDPHLQVILGLLTLCKYLFSEPSTPNFSRETCMALCPSVFVEYLRRRCLRKLRGDLPTGTLDELLRRYSFNFHGISSLPDITEFSCYVVSAALLMEL